jgi:Excalibur calcium-binding domain
MKFAHTRSIKYVFILYFVIFKSVEACPCFNDGYVFTAFHTLKGVQCMQYVERKSIGTVDGELIAYVIFHANGDYAKTSYAQAISQVSDASSFGGNCSMNLMFRSDTRKINSANEFRSCSNAIINTCNRIGVRMVSHGVTNTRQYQCKDLRSCDEAKQKLREGHKYLDVNNNGIPCEGTLCPKSVWCEDLTTCQEAMQMLKEGHIELDADRDGIPCEQTLCRAR